MVEINENDLNMNKKGLKQKRNEVAREILLDKTKKA